MGLNITKNYLTKNDCYKSGRTITSIGIQNHTIGTAQNTAQSLADYWNQPGISACVHYAVDAEVEGKALQFLPEDRRSWADAGYGNNNLITVEGMESDYMRYTGGASFVVTNEAKFKSDIKRSYNGMVALNAKICKEHGWEPMTKLPNGLYLVSSHNEGRKAGVSSHHSDPDHVWGGLGYTMDGFRKDVKAAMGDAKKRMIAKDLTYTVRKGDTLTAIAKDFTAQGSKMSVAYLKKWNGLKDDKITTGQKLKLYYGKIEVTKKAAIRTGALSSKKKVGSAKVGKQLYHYGSRINAKGNKWYKVWNLEDGVQKLRYVYSKKSKKI